MSKDSGTPSRAVAHFAKRLAHPSVPRAPITLSTLVLATLVMLSASSAPAQEVIRCFDDPVVGIPDECASFVFDIETTGVSDPGGVFRALGA